MIDYLSIILQKSSKEIDEPLVKQLQKERPLRKKIGYRPQVAPALAEFWQNSYSISDKVFKIELFQNALKIFTETFKKSELSILEAMRCETELVYKFMLQFLGSDQISIEKLDPTHLFQINRRYNIGTKHYKPEPFVKQVLDPLNKDGTIKITEEIRTIIIKDLCTIGEKPKAEDFFTTLYFNHFQKYSNQLFIDKKGKLIKVTEKDGVLKTELADTSGLTSHKKKGWGTLVFTKEGELILHSNLVTDFQFLKDKSGDIPHFFNQHGHIVTIDKENCLNLTISHLYTREELKDQIKFLSIQIGPSYERDPEVFILTNSQTGEFCSLADKNCILYLSQSDNKFVIKTIQDNQLVPDTNSKILKIITEKGNSLIKSEEARIPHSCHVYGSCVQGGLEFKIEKGRLVGITLYTGHYLTKPEDLLKVLELLRKQNVDLSSTKIYVTSAKKIARKETLVKDEQELKLFREQLESCIPPLDVNLFEAVAKKGSELFTVLLKLMTFQFPEPIKTQVTNIFLNPRGSQGGDIIADILEIIKPEAANGTDNHSNNNYGKSKTTASNKYLDFFIEMFDHLDPEQHDVQNTEKIEILLDAFLTAPQEHENLHKDLLDIELPIRRACLLYLIQKTSLTNATEPLFPTKGYQRLMDLLILLNKKNLSREELLTYLSDNLIEGYFNPKPNSLLALINREFISALNLELKGSSEKEKFNFIMKILQPVDDQSPSQRRAYVEMQPML